MEELQRSLALFKPEVALTAGLLLVVVVDSVGAAWRNVAMRLLTLASLAVALGLAFNLQASGAKEALFSGMLVVDPLGAAFKVILVAGGLLTVLVFTFRNSRELHGLGQGELMALVLALVLSSLLLASANDLVMLYLALEMVSITSYVMVAYLKGDRMANEASLKYVLFGAASTGTMLYGLSFLYGMTGTTSLPGVQEFLAGGIPEANRFAVYAITLLVLVGFGFKIAAVPFHFWCPDVYQGAATPVTALLSVLPKAAGLAIVLRFFYGTFSTRQTGPWDLVGSIDWAALLMVLSVLTMTVGNVAALTQTNMKRLLAYSSIAHAGYLLTGRVALSAADPGHGVLPALARGHPAVRRLPREAVRLRRGHREGHGRLRDDRRGERGDRGLLLLPRPQGDDDRRGERGQARTAARDRRPGLARGLRPRQPRPAPLLEPGRGLGPRRARDVRGAVAPTRACHPEELRPSQATRDPQSRRIPRDPSHPGPSEWHL